MLLAHLMDPYCLLYCVSKIFINIELVLLRIINIIPYKVHYLLSYVQSLIATNGKITANAGTPEHNLECVCLCMCVCVGGGGGGGLNGAAKI